MSELDNYLDVLEDRHKYGDLFWVTRKWESPEFRFSAKRTPKQITHDVFHDNRIQLMISEVSKKRGVEREVIIKEVNLILKEMSHNFQLKAIRFFGYILAKTAKRLYTHIYVNKDCAEKIQNVSNKYPMIFMPTHRSYADFLLVSYICFHFNLPLPVIAAGLDFLGLKAISMLLRNSGAFFIRRQFGDDKLYWTVFLVYIQSHIIGGEFPVEFFVEGTRSRTAKSLLPKLGLLQVAAELFFTGRVPDITIIPISMSYDRTLEEMLYAYELLGVPKPKESTKGLVKARKILQQNFGNVYVNFGNPISLKDFCNEKIDRSLHNLEPKFLPSLTHQERLTCLDLANHVIKIHQRSLLLSPFPLMCLVIGNAGFKRKLSQFELFVQVDWLCKLLNRTGASVVYGEGASLQESITYHLDVHSNILYLADDGYIEVINQVEKMGSNVDTLLVDSLVHAIPEILFYHYGNQALQLLVQYSMIAMCLFTTSNFALTADATLQKYKILLKLLSAEFVFERHTITEEFNNSVMVLLEEGIITEEGNQKLTFANFDKMKFLANLLVPFLQCYGCVCEQFLNGKIKKGTSKEIAQQAQKGIEISLCDGEINYYKSLSLDMLTNCVMCLAKLNALWKERKNGKTTYSPILPEVATVLCDIELFLPNQDKTKNIKWDGSNLSKL